MTAKPYELAELGRKLWRHGVAGYCPTTLSTRPKDLALAVTHLGQWIRSENSAPTRRGEPLRALPLGIHLEGPFINSGCCGAHPPSRIRPLDFAELENLWQLSQGTLRILTVAPETLSREHLRHLSIWAHARGISLSLGHSKATEIQARQAFETGFRGITHAWNALGFHQRSPGPLGAAFGNPDAYVELIIDQVHVAPSVLAWTQQLHPANRLCFISDCVPAAETKSGRKASFGPLRIQYKGGACRLFAPGKPTHGALAGGGKILTRSFCEWIERYQDPKKALRESIASITEAPLWALQFPAGPLARHRVRWSVSASGRVSVKPIDSY